MLFTLWRLDEAPVALGLYKLHNLMCICFLSVAMIDYSEKSNFGEKGLIFLKVPKELQSITADLAS